MSLRVLLVESDPEETLLLQDVVSELQGSGYWGSWVEIALLHAPTWWHAAAILVDGFIDVILLNPNLEDSQGVETYRHAAALAPDCPIILLIRNSDMDLAFGLVRDGAQDFVITRELDCRPFARMLRNAVERQRLVNGIRYTSMVDSLTGLMNRSAFLALADRDRKLAERLGRRLMIMVADPLSPREPAASKEPGANRQSPSQREQRRDLILVETADHLRALIGPTDLVARITDSSFGIAVFDTDIETLESAWSRIHCAAAEHRVSIGAAIFDGNHPATLETLLEQAVQDLPPKSFAMRT